MVPATAARGLRPRRGLGGLAPARRRARIRDYGGVVPPPHGAHAGRHDARALPRRAETATGGASTLGGRHGAAVGSLSGLGPVRLKAPMRSRYVGALVSAAAVASGCATGASSPPTESRG